MGSRRRNARRDYTIGSPSWPAERVRRPAERGFSGRVNNRNKTCFIPGFCGAAAHTGRPWLRFKLAMPISVNGLCLSVFPRGHDFATVPRRVDAAASIIVDDSFFLFVCFFAFLFSVCRSTTAALARRTRDFRHVRFIDVFFPGRAGGGSTRGS